MPTVKVLPMKVLLRRCTMLEYLGTKDGVERVIATVSLKDGKVVVEADDPEVKKELLEVFSPPSVEAIEARRAEEGDEETEKNLKGGYPAYLLLGIDEGEVHKDIAIPQRRGDPYYLEAHIGPWEGNIGLAGYTEIWARDAGKVWNEEVEI